MRFFAAGVLFLLPAAALAAGFAPGALFLSSSPVTEGDSVRIYAVVTNTATAAFSGRLVFKEGSTELGSLAVTLPAASTQTLSTGWKPLAGSHTIVADLEAQDGSVAQEESATFSVNPKPQPASALPSNNSAGIDSSQSIQDGIGKVSPQAESATAPAFRFVDGVRQSAAQALDGQLASTKPKIAHTPPNTTIGGQSVPNPTSGFWYALWLIYFYFLTVLRFIVGSAAVFYPIAAILFLWFLWKMFRRFRRA